jgi:hypothetical protein
MPVEFHPDGFPKMHTVLPEGAEHNGIHIVHETPSEKDAQFTMLRAMISGGDMGRGTVQAGQTICQVWSGDRLWMSDTRDERNDHWKARRMARV